MYTPNIIRLNCSTGDIDTWDIFDNPSIDESLSTGSTIFVEYNDENVSEWELGSFSISFPSWILILEVLLFTFVSSNFWQYSISSIALLNVKTL